MPDFQTYLSQYGKIPPVLASANTPKVKSTSNLGTGGGAAVQTPDSGGYGSILIYPGSSPGASGNVVITFPSTPPTLVFYADGDIGAVTQATVGNDVTVSWTAAKMVGPNSKPYRIRYEWAVSD